MKLHCNLFYIEVYKKSKIMTVIDSFNKTIMFFWADFIEFNQF